MNQNQFRKQLAQWLSPQPYWLQYLGAKAMEGDVLAGDISKAYQYFLEDNKLVLSRMVRENVVIDVEEENTLAQGMVAHLKNVSDVKSVNALTNNQTIEFCKNVTVIYGENGAGKTGYIRLFNKVFASRGDKEIIPNIFVEKVNTQPSARFRFQIGESCTDVDYPTTRHTLFSSFSVFDTQSVRVHIDESNEMSFVPRGFEFFKALASACDSLDGQLKADISKKNIANTFAIHFKSDSELCQLVRQIDLLLEFDKVSAVAGEIADDEIKKLELEKGELMTLNVEKTVADLNNIVKGLLSLKLEIGQILARINDASLKMMKDDIGNFKSAEQRAKEVLEGQAELGHITHIDSKEWKLFIQAGHSFGHLQRDTHYPQTGDHCIFCFQTLNTDAITLINNYWNLIQGDAEEELAKCLKKIGEHTTLIEQVAVPSLGDELRISQWLSENTSDLLAIWRSWSSSLKVIKESVLQSLTAKHWNDEVELISLDVDSVDVLVQDVRNKIDGLNLADQNKKMADVDKRISLVREKQLLKSLLPVVEAYIESKSWARKAENTISQLNTKRITVKQSDVYGSLIAGPYKAHFQEECIKLDVSLKIELDYKGEKGKTLRKLRIGAHSPKSVLSEGEQRAVALADFLAEVRMNPNNVGIIFDDPVTSLDNNRKEIIANRLVEESANRQVIIFTHDLVFLHHIKEAALKHDQLEVLSHWIRREGDAVGTIHLDNSPANEGDYGDAKKAKLWYEKSLKAGPQEEESYLKNGFAALRTCYEYFVIKELFGDVVKRFQERISIDRLKGAYLPPDIVAAVIEKVGYLSRFIEAHLHSNEFIPIKPAPGLLKAEIETYEKLKKDFRAGRPKAA